MRIVSFNKYVIVPKELNNVPDENACITERGTKKLDNLIVKGNIEAGIMETKEMKMLHVTMEPIPVVYMLPKLKKHRLCQYQNLHKKQWTLTGSLWIIKIQHFKTQGRVFSNKGRMMQVGEAQAILDKYNLWVVPLSLEFRSFLVFWMVMPFLSALLSIFQVLLFS